MNKLFDINYALMAQLSYLQWNKLDKNKFLRSDEKGNIISESKNIKDILLNGNILEDIKTEFYDNPEYLPENEEVKVKATDNIYVEQ